MDDKLALALITSFTTFGFFVILDLWKTAREKRERNIRALRSISFELGVITPLLADEELNKTMWLDRDPMRFNTNIWEKYCGEIIISNKERYQLELFYENLFTLNNHAEYLYRSRNVKAGLENAASDEMIYEVYLTDHIKALKTSVAKNKNVLLTTIEKLEKEKWWITIPKEIFGPSHRIITLLQDFSNKSKPAKN